MSLTTVNLGFVKSIFVSLTAPTNINAIWFDDNIGIKKHKYYNQDTSTWTEIASNFTGSLTTDRITKASSASTFSDSYFLENGDGVLIDSGKMLMSSGGVSKLSLEDGFVELNVDLTGYASAYLYLDATLARLAFSDTAALIANNLGFNINANNGTDYATLDLGIAGNINLVSNDVTGKFVFNMSGTSGMDMGSDGHEQISMLNNSISNKGSDSSTKYSLFLASRLSTINAGVTNTLMLGGSGLWGKTSNTAYVQQLGYSTTGVLEIIVGFQTPTTDRYLRFPDADGVLSTTDYVDNSLFFYVSKSGDAMSGALLADGGVDVTSTGGSDVLSIGVSNADIINIGHAGATVNILGTAVYEIAINSYITDKLITLNSGGGAATGGGTGFEIEEDSVIVGYFKVNGSRNGFDIKAPDNDYTLEFKISNLTADRTISTPDITGTIALINGGQTFTSATWNGTAIADTYIATSYIKADGTRALTGHWAAGLFDISARTFSTSGTAGAGFMEVTTQSANVAVGVANSVRLWSRSGVFAFTPQSDGFYRLLDGVLTGNRVYSFPDRNGTLADDTDLSLKENYLDINSAYILSPASIGASQNNYNPTGLSTASILRLTSSGAYSITGITAPSTWKKLIIFNVGASNITLSDADAGSTAANRFDMNGNVILNSSEGITLLYDLTSARWRVSGRAN